jgi:glucose 1-dehydrogenase
MACLQGKVAIITGASSGIGQGIAKRFGKEGASVAIDYVSHPEGAEATRKTIDEAGGKAITVQADITKKEDRERLVAETWKAFGFADILVNNAGTEKRSDFWEMKEEDYDRVMDVNLKSAVFLTQIFVRRLRDAKRPGRIINISSVHEDMAFPGFTAYCCSKGGLRMFARNLAVELGPWGITVNNIAPGAIATPINRSLLEDKQELEALLANVPLHRMGTPEDVAGMAAFLASDDAAYVSGSTFVIDGGLMRSYHEQ